MPRIASQAARVNPGPLTFYAIPLYFEDWYFVTQFYFEGTDVSSQSIDIQAELARRHKAAATTIAGLMIAAILLSVVAFLGKSYFMQQSNAPLETALMFAILFLGLGSIVWRRTRFATMRLSDIAGLQGPIGLLSTLEKTTIQLAFFGATIAALGFIATLITGNEAHTYRGTAISLVVLLYSYPTKRSWERVLDYFDDSGSPGPTNKTDDD